MPTYEYACQKCGYEFEQYQSIKDEPLKRCPKCKGKVVKKISSGAGLIFKGSGFYITDYRSEKYKSAAKSDAQAVSAATSSGDSKPSATAAPAASTSKKK